jgi:hypothetical protein
MVRFKTANERSLQPMCIVKVTACVAIGLLISRKRQQLMLSCDSDIVV